MHSHSSFDGGIHTSRKCLFNNQLKVSQAASLQGNVYTEELSEESKKRGRKIHHGGDTGEIVRETR